MLDLLLGSTKYSSKEEMDTRQKDIDQEEDLVQVPSIDEIFSTCIKLLHAKDPIAFPLKDLTLTSCIQNDGQERAKVILFLVEQLKYCNWDHGKENSMLFLPSHVFDIIYMNTIQLVKLLLTMVLLVFCWISCLAFTWIHQKVTSF